MKRLDDARSRIGAMCSKGRPPSMSIPARPDVDDDLVICATLDAAKSEITTLRAELNCLHTATHRGDLSLATLAEANRVRAIEWTKEGTGEQPSELFAVVELLGEAGEFANAMKKLERARLGIVGGNDDQQGAQEELADVVICCSLMAIRMGWDLGEIVTRKFNATSVKRAFSTMLPVQSALAEAAEQGGGS